MPEEVSILSIELHCEDDSDATWLRDKLVPIVESYIEEEQGTLDGHVDVIAGMVNSSNPDHYV